MYGDALYQEVILDHYKRPHGRGLRDPFDAEVHHTNPTCGDEVTLRVRLDGGRTGGTVEDVSYEGQGCSISQAAASVLHDLLVGQPVEQAMSTLDTFVELMQSRGRMLDRLESLEDTLEDAVAFAGVSKYPARVKCALLPWMAFKDATAKAVGDGVGRD
ncbi:MAG TPA: SUF system NifU family Fe-S cluster assembly protein [Cryptosporangiaceae bacterium]|nr:SUF system NifU family Fe-S cluster assembly protein [Cryptosporangiaceae bacterium]